MTHEDVRELLLDLSYGELPAAEARVVEAHLAGCEACRAERDRLAATRRLMQGLGEEEAPRGEGILMAAARQAVERPRRASLFSWVRLATGLAVLLIVGGVTMELLSARRADDAEERFAERPAAAPALVLDAGPAPRAKAAAPEPPAPAASAPARPAPATRSAPSYAAPPPRAREERAERLAEGRGAPVAGDPAAPPAAEPSAPMPAGAPETGAEAAFAKRGPSGAAEEAKAAPARPAPAAPAPRREAAQAGARGAAPLQLQAAAPDEAEQAPSARKLARPQAAADADGGEGAALVAEITRLRDAGQLHEARRHPEPCPGGDTARLAWLDGLGVARRFARTGPLPAGMGAGQATRDQWYDAQGRLRHAVVEGDGPQGRFRRRILLGSDGALRSEDPPGGAPWPRADLTLSDPAAAFWAPQRCAGR